MKEVPAMDDVVRIAREIMGWIGSKPIRGDHPWDAGVMPETATQDESGRPVGYDPEVPYFSVCRDTLHDGGLLVFGPEDVNGKRGRAFFWDPFKYAESAQMVLERLGRGHVIFDAVRQEVRQYIVSR